MSDVEVQLDKLTIGEHDIIVVRTNTEGLELARKTAAESLHIIRKKYPDALIMLTGVGIEAWVEQRNVTLVLSISHPDWSTPGYDKDILFVEERLVWHVERNNWTTDGSASRTTRISMMVCPSQLAAVLRDKELMAKVVTWEAY